MQSPMVKLSDCKIGSWTMTADLLGVAERMADSDWLQPLKEIMDATLLSISAATDELRTTQGPKLYQYGDALTFVADDPQLLIRIGIKLQLALYADDILAQVALTEAGAYFIDNTLVHQIAKSTAGISLSILAGQGIARSHLLLRGMRGPRFLIDEEFGQVSPDGTWQRLLVKDKQAYAVTEVAWWKGDEFVLQRAQRRVRSLQSELAETPDDPVSARRFRSMEKRLHHYEAFIAVLTDSES